MPKNLPFILLLLLLSACSGSKYYFNQRISHPSISVEAREPDLISTSPAWHDDEHAIQASEEKEIQTLKAFKEKEIKTTQHKTVPVAKGIHSGKIKKVRQETQTAFFPEKKIQQLEKEDQEKELVQTKKKKDPVKRFLKGLIIVSALALAASVIYVTAGPQVLIAIGYFLLIILGALGLFFLKALAEGSRNCPNDPNTCPDHINGTCPNEPNRVQ